MQQETSPYITILGTKSGLLIRLTGCQRAEACTSKHNRIDAQSGLHFASGCQIARPIVPCIARQLHGFDLGDRSRIFTSLLGSMQQLYQLKPHRA